MNEAVFCVYIICNTVNSKIYIGLTCAGLDERWRRHKSLANTGRSKNQLYEDIRAYGSNVFTIESIEDNISYSIAYVREAYWIDQLGSIVPHGYNRDNWSRKRSRSKS